MKAKLWNSVEEKPAVQIMTSISDNADGPRDAASRKIASITLHAKWNHQARQQRYLVPFSSYYSQKWPSLTYPIAFGAP